MLRLTESLQDDLLSQPESGMGYQLVRVTMTDGLTRRGIVYNAELVLFDEELRGPSQKSHTELLTEARNAAGTVRKLDVMSRSTPTHISIAERRNRTTYSGPAKDAPKEKTGAGEVFKRFTAYPNDRRIRPDRSLRPGTYATTVDDAQQVKTGRDAVRRYALPDPTPASCVFTVTPHVGTTIQYGIVEPAYGQPGGGVEALFADGTQLLTVSGPTKMPD